jgi:methylase of polypeptide subunit release factors
MINIEDISIDFQQGLNKLGFVVEDDALFLVGKDSDDVDALFHIYQAGKFGATAVYLRRQMNGSYRPQVYLYDKTQTHFANRNEDELADIQKKLWTSGEAPLACIFYDTHFDILDCTKHVHVDNNEFKPEYLINVLNLAGKAHKLYNEHFAVKIKSGIFWEEEENKNRFKFQNNSSYDSLISNIRDVENQLAQKLKNVPKDIVTKIIVQSILIKYLEERIDSNGNRLLSDKYFKKYDNAQTFGDVLRKRKFVDLIDDLNDEKNGFNGNVFEWKDTEKEELKKLDLSIVADLLATDKPSLSSLQLEIKFPDWRYFEFRYIPVELISRLYEEFLGENKKEKGLYYTPSHLAKLLVDECLPLNLYDKINLSDYKILDPACGSGIFLVLVFKRLVQIWKLQHRNKNTHKLPKPTIDDLKSLLRNIYGVDKEGQAIRLAAFSLSLALCDELEPMQIINELKFEDLQKNNLIEHDFFTCDKIKDKQFDLLIGNPPFKRGSVSNNWIIDNKKIKIPQGQLALKFLSESFPVLRNNGLVCLIIKSSGLLYNSSSYKYKKALFENKNVVQILDFTALARNKSLWDNGADVASAAVFAKNEKPDFTKNILHLTFRRTKASKERITFEIDDYDLHYVNRRTAIENEYIWKNNLLGGGRIKILVEKAQELPTFESFLKRNNCVNNEGFILGKNGNLSPEYIYNIPTLPTKAISESGIDYSKLENLNRNLSFKKVPPQITFEAPNILIWENVGEKTMPVFYNEDVSFSFKDSIISVASKDKNKTLLKEIAASFLQNSNFYRFYIFVTSGETLINRNTSTLKEDYIKKLRFLDSKSQCTFSSYDENIVSDVNTFMSDFINHGEKSIAIKSIRQKDFKSVLLNYGIEFSGALNSIYEDDNRRFRLSNVVTLKNSLIAVVFKYDNTKEDVKFQKDLSELNIEGLTDHKISSQLSVNRIIKLYPQKDTIVFVKPNQYRYWLSLIAYRDADKCFSDFVDAGY